LFATTQEERFLENGDESPPPLVITDLRELSDSPSTAAAASASDAEGTRQAQDTQAEEEEEEEDGKKIFNTYSFLSLSLSPVSPEICTDGTHFLSLQHL
jgi:hypothetical protein